MDQVIPKREFVKYRTNFLGNIRSHLAGLQGYDVMALELIQNADDAKAEKIVFNITDDSLIVCNNKNFSYCRGDLNEECAFPAVGKGRCDYHGIIVVGSGNKPRENIGRFGIGFVSTYQVTDRPEILSSGIKLTLNPEEPDECTIEHFDEPCGTSFILPWAKNKTKTRSELQISPISNENIDLLTEHFQSVLRKSLLFLKHIRIAEVWRNGQLLLACDLKRDEKDSDCDPEINEKDTDLMEKLGAPILTLERLVKLLESSLVQQEAGVTKVNESDLEHFYRPLWSIINELISKKPKMDPTVQRLMELPFVISEDMYVVTINPSYAAQPPLKANRIATLLSRLAIISRRLSDFENIKQLVKPLNLGAVVDYINKECAAGRVEEIIGTNRENLRDLYSLFDDLDRQSSVEKAVYHKLRGLPIWLSKRDMDIVKADQAFLPGGFTDPTGQVILLDTSVLSASVIVFLQTKLDIKTLSIEAYVKNWLPKFFGDNGPADKTKYALLISELAKNHQPLVNNEEILKLLGGFKIVPTRNGGWAVPRDTYRRTDELAKVLGESPHLWLDDSRIPDTKPVRDFIDGLGIQKLPLAKHLVSRMLSIAEKSPPNEDARRESSEAFYALCDNLEKWKDKETSLKTISDLKREACFPADEDTEKWHTANSLYIPFRAEAFRHSQAKIVYFKNTQRLRTGGSDLFDMLGVRKPETSLVIEHLQYCVSNGLDPHFFTYQVLNERAQSDSPLIKAKLAAEACIYVESQKKFVRPTSIEIDSQYTQASNFLNKLTEFFLDKDKTRIIIVPGNHDINWNTSKESMCKCAKAINVLDEIKRNSKSRWSWEELCLYEIGNNDIYDSRMDCFINFYNNFYDGAKTYSKNPKEQYQVFDIASLNIACVAYNSCYRNDHLNGAGCISPSCFTNSSDELRNLHKMGRLLIAVWHHHTSGLPQENNYLDYRILKNMIDQNIQIGLFGHQHLCNIVNEYKNVLDNKRMLLISAGTLYGDKSFLPPNTQRQYNIILLQLNEASIKFEIFIREDKSQAFEIPMWDDGKIDGTLFSSWDTLLTKPKIPDLEILLNQIIADAERDNNIGSAIDQLRKMDTSNVSVRKVLLSFLSENKEHDLVYQYFSVPENNTEAIFLMEAVSELGDQEKIIKVINTPFIYNNQDSAVRKQRNNLQFRVKDKKYGTN